MKISHTGIDSSIKYLEQQEEGTPAILLSLKKCRIIAAEKHQSNITQKLSKGLFLKVKGFNYRNNMNCMWCICVLFVFVEIKI